METTFSPDILLGLQQARIKKAVRKNRWRVHAGDSVHAIFELRRDGFSMVTEDAPHIRGLVDVYNGAEHIMQCLVIHSEQDGAVMHYEFKRRTEAHDEAPKDFAVDKDAPVALIERS